MCAVCREQCVHIFGEPFHSIKLKSKQRRDPFVLRPVQSAPALLFREAALERGTLTSVLAELSPPSFCPVSQNPASRWVPLSFLKHRLLLPPGVFSFLDRDVPSPWVPLSFLKHRLLLPSGVFSFLDRDVPCLTSLPVSFGVSSPLVSPRLVESPEPVLGPLPYTARRPLCSQMLSASPAYVYTVCLLMTSRVMSLPLSSRRNSRLLLFGTYLQSLDTEIV